MTDIELVVSNLILRFEEFGLLLSRFIGILTILILLFAVLWYSYKILSLKPVKSEIAEGIITDFKRGKEKTVTRFRGRVPVLETVIGDNVVVVTVDGIDLDVKTDSYKYSYMIGDNVKVKTTSMFKKGSWVVESQELVD